VSKIIVENANTWRLSGELTFATVGALLTEFTQKVPPFGKGGSGEIKTPPKVLDLCDVTRTDSAGLALLIELLKLTKDAPITFRNIPAQMHSLAAVSGVQDMLSSA
jgi:phospholipid transport system transporter-binding protein